MSTPTDIHESELLITGDVQFAVIVFPAGDTPFASSAAVLICVTQIVINGTTGAIAYIHFHSLLKFEFETFRSILLIPSTGAAIKASNLFKLAQVLYECFARLFCTTFIAIVAMSHFLT